MNCLDSAIGHILWTIQHSPKSYLLFRERLTELRVAIVNSELQQIERDNEHVSHAKAKRV